MGRRANGEGSVYQRGGKWFASITAGQTQSGGRRRIVRKCRSQADAVATLKELRAKYATLEPHFQSVAQYLDRWMENVVSELTENTQQAYRNAIDVHIRPVVGSLKLQSLTPSHIENVLKRLATGTRTRLAVYQCLSSALNHAVRLRLIPDNPVKPLPRPRYERQEIRPFTLEESRKIIAETKDDRFHALYVLALQLGMRESELFGLEWKHVDLKAGKLRIVQQATEIRGKVVVRKPKSAAGIRVVDLPETCIVALQSRRAAALRDGQAGNPRVFPSARGTWLRGSTFRRNEWRPLLKRLGIEYRNPHCMRHTYCSLSLGAGVAVHTVAKIAGHHSPAFLLKVYAHVLQSDQSQAAQTVARLFG